MGTGVTHSNVVGGTVEGPGRAEIVKVAFASLIGTSVEWYDFFLYGTAAALVFNKLFFPQFDPLVGHPRWPSRTFAVGFIARPSAASSSATTATGSAARRCCTSPC